MIVNKTRDFLNIRNLASTFKTMGLISSVPEYVDEMQKLVRYAKAHPKEFRDARATMKHHRDMGYLSEYYTKLVDYLTKLESKYGNRSLPFRTLIEAVSVVKLTNDQVRASYLKHPIPPAYDPSKRSSLSRDKVEGTKGFEIRNKFFEWIDATNDTTILTIKEILSKPYLSRLDDTSYDKSKISDHFILQNNGTTCGIEWKGYRILDIEGQVFIPQDVDIDEMFPYTLRYFKIKNYREGKDGHTYLTLPIDKDHSGYHTVIADKDGKTREVYYLIPVYQCISKGIAKALDKAMRLCPGIYTYNQRDWIQNALDLNWIKDSNIITIDMEKFSDTIVREYFLELLVHLGIPRIVVDELDKLYSLPIWDIVQDKPLGSHDVILQGQYSIFMLMSLLNLSLQRYLNFKFNSEIGLDKLNSLPNALFSAVLGDDTAMLFISKDSSRIISFLQDLYGSFGMKINKLKSDNLNYGVGQADFAKISFDRDGIVDFINPRNIFNQNMDSFIEDVLQLQWSHDKKLEFFTIFFNSETIAKEIMSLSIINGGPSDHPIQREDIIYFINNLHRINGLLKEDSITEERRVLKLLVDEYHQYGLSLKDSVLVEYLSKEDKSSLESLSIQESDDLIVASVLNARVVGWDINFDYLYNSVGIQPSALKEAYNHAKLHEPYNESYLNLYLEFQKFESFSAKRRLKNSARYSSIFEPLISGFSSQLYHDEISWTNNNTAIKVNSIEEYDKVVLDYKASKRIQMLKDIGVPIVEYSVGRNRIRLITLNTPEGPVSRRLHFISSQYYTSQWSSLSEDEFNEYIAPLLEKHRWDTDYMTFKSIWTIYN